MTEEYHILYNNFKNLSIRSCGDFYSFRFDKKDMQEGYKEDVAVFDLRKEDIEELLKVLQKINIK